jgi:hypothetical protein
MEFSDVAVIKCSHESCVKWPIKSNLQSKPHSRVTLTRDSILNINEIYTQMQYLLWQRSGYALCNSALNL